MRFNAWFSTRPSGLLLLLCLTVCVLDVVTGQSNHATQLPMGNIYDHVVWKKEDSPIEIDRDLYIIKIGSLSIMEGVIVRFLGPYSIYVRGTVDVMGSSSAPVEFHGGQYGLNLMTSTASANVQWANFYNQSLGGIVQSTYEGINEDLPGFCSVDHCQFEGNGAGTGYHVQRGTISHTVFTNYETGISTVAANISDVSISHCKTCLSVDLTTRRGFYETSTAKLSGSVVSHCDYGIQFFNYGSANPVVEFVSIEDIERAAVTNSYGWRGVVRNTTIRRVSGTGIVGVRSVESVTIEGVLENGIDFYGENEFGEYGRDRDENDDSGVAAVVRDTTLRNIGLSGIVGAKTVENVALEDIGMDGIIGVFDYSRSVTGTVRNAIIKRVGNIGIGRMETIDGATVGNAGNTGIESVVSVRNSVVQGSGRMGAQWVDNIQNCTISDNGRIGVKGAGRIADSLVVGHEIGIQTAVHPDTVSNDEAQYQIVRTNICGNKESNFDAMDTFGFSTLNDVWLGNHDGVGFDSNPGGNPVDEGVTEPVNPTNEDEDNHHNDHGMYDGREEEYLYQEENEGMPNGSPSMEQALQENLDADKVVISHDNISSATASWSTLLRVLPFHAYSKGYLEVVRALPDPVPAVPVDPRCLLEIVENALPSDMPSDVPSNVPSTVTGNEPSDAPSIMLGSETGNEPSTTPSPSLLPTYSLVPSLRTFPTDSTGDECLPAGDFCEAEGEIKCCGDFVCEGVCSRPSVSTPGVNEDDDGFVLSAEALLDEQAPDRGNINRGRLLGKLRGGT